MMHHDRHYHTTRKLVLNKNLQNTCYSTRSIPIFAFAKYKKPIMPKVLPTMTGKDRTSLEEAVGERRSGRNVERVDYNAMHDGSKQYLK